MEGLFRIATTLVPEELEAALVARLKLYGNLGLIADRELRGEGDQSYRCPNSGRLMDFILNRRDLLEAKADHGFTDVEIGLGISGKQWLGALRMVIMTHAENLKSPWGLPLLVDTGGLVYDYWYNDPNLPLFYRRGTDWVTKSVFYNAQPFPGIHIAFARPADDDMPRRGWGGGETGDRPNLAGGISPLEQYDLFGTGAYTHESACTVDLAMARMLYSIEERQIVPHVYTRDRGTIAWCARNRFGLVHENMVDAQVPCHFWDVCDRGLTLSRRFASDRHVYYAPPAVVGLEE